jgi:hypothetical protein
MTIGSGVGAQLGFAPEVSYGTYVAPTKWLQATKNGLKKNKNTKQGTGMAAGRLIDLGGQRVVTSQDAAGQISTTVWNKGLGQLWQAIMGGTTVTPVQPPTFRPSRSATPPAGP